MYAPFSRLCPEVAKQETRTITVRPVAPLGLPAADYEFVEMYCDEPGCDCRRVMFFVISSARMDVEAVIAWGWENRDFYVRWFGQNDPATIKELQGPVLNMGSPQTQYSEAVLQLAKQFLLSDPAYVERIKRHYALFRERVEQAGTGGQHGRPAPLPDEKRGGRKSAKERRRQAWKRGGSGRGR